MVSFPTVVPYVLVLFRKDTTVLLIKRENTGFGDNLYGLVGGKVEDETFRQAAVRETFEEIGVKIKEEDLELVHVLHRKGTENTLVSLIFQVKKWAGQPFNKEPHKHSEIKWFSFNDLPPMVPAHQQALACIHQGIVCYSEHGWEPC